VPRPDHPGEYLFRIGAEAAGRRLDRYLADKFRRSRTSLVGRLEGCVFARGAFGDGAPGGRRRPLPWGHRLQAGEEILVRSEVRPEPEVEVSYRLLHRDEHLVVVDKGSGAPVHPVRGFRERTIVSRLRAELGLPDLEAAHRLDRETSGALLLARGREVLHALMRQFAGREVDKRYLAVVRGVPGFERTRVEARLGPDPEFSLAGRVRVVEDGGQAATTELEVLTRGADRALVAAHPLTGRTHQIRVHLAHLGHPILGDKLYQEGGRPHLDMIKDRLGAGALARLGHTRLALHAARLAFTHPVSGERLVFEVELPGDLAALVAPTPPVG
jgi:23S rRNA pseudouridine1911/1915/1917 synthase